MSKFRTPFDKQTHPGLSGETSGAGTYYIPKERGLPVYEDGHLNISIEWTGSPLGTIFFEVTSGTDDNTWTEVTSASKEFTKPNGSPIAESFGFVDVPGARWRIRYVQTSGTSTYNASFS